mmetsp:Transcript_122335/g.357097  ORF Transcript_122335/g.357097 Transcript_122335/m.357097 type:complete len:320 (+) Transcript_122335:137-1096(+)
MSLIATPSSDVRISHVGAQPNPSVLSRSQAPAGHLQRGSPPPAWTPLPSAASTGAPLVQTPIKTSRVLVSSNRETTSAMNGFVQKHPWVQQHPLGIQVRNTFVDYKVVTPEAPWSEPRRPKRDALSHEASPAAAGTEQPRGGGPASPAGETLESQPGEVQAQAGSAEGERHAETKPVQVPTVVVQEVEPDVVLPASPVGTYMSATPTSSIRGEFDATPSPVGSMRGTVASHMTRVPPLPGQPPIAAPRVLRLSSYLLSPGPSRPVLRLADTLMPPSVSALPSRQVELAEQGQAAERFVLAPAPVMGRAEEVQPRRLWFT